MQVMPWKYLREKRTITPTNSLLVFDSISKVSLGFKAVIWFKAQGINSGLGAI
jgi:hypothetical protein